VISDSVIAAVVGNGQSGTVVVQTPICSDSVSGFLFCVRPSSPMASDTVICSGQSAGLTANGSGSIGWYSSASGGSYLGGGSLFTTQNLSVTTIYYVQDSTCARSAVRTPVTVQVSQLSDAGSISGSAEVCFGGGDTLHLSTIQVKFSGSLR